VKIAIASNNGATIQRHFGRTSQYVVVTFDADREVAREVRTVDGSPDREHGEHPHHLGSLLSPIADCNVLVANGMGVPMAGAVQDSGMRLILTNERLVDVVVTSFVAGTLTHHPELAHQPGH
jgi:predicted Fe-Mo cluster-binding NifX family protein